jgi:predicted amidohydrolase
MSEIVISAANLSLGRLRSENWRQVEVCVAEAVRRGTDVLVLPEMCVQGYPDFSDSNDSLSREHQMKYYAEESETLPGPSSDSLALLLSQTEMIVQIGIAEVALDGARYNSVGIVTRRGLVGRYRKTHNRWETPYFTSGSILPVTETRIGKVGSLICSDLDFPEAARVLALQGAEIILVSTAWPVREQRTRDSAQTRPHLELCARAAAFCNQVWVAVSDHSESGGLGSSVEYGGGTMLVNPQGDVVVASSQQDEIISTRVDLHSSILDARRYGFFEMNLLVERRPDLYGPLVTDYDAEPDDSI